MKRSSIMATATMVIAALVATPAIGETGHDSVDSTGQGDHCVAQVIGQAVDGELKLADPVCFDSFDQSLRFAGAESRHEITPERMAEGLVSAGSYILAVHYDQTSYNGLSLTVTAQNPQCTGGYINFRTAYTNWNNRFESIIYSCDGGPITHWDIAPASGGSCSGSQFDATKNEPTLGAMNNRTSCVVYGP